MCFELSHPTTPSPDLPVLAEFGHLGLKQSEPAPIFDATR